MRTESEERIANAGAGAGFWTTPQPAPNQSALELGEVDKGHACTYSAAVGGGKEGARNTWGPDPDKDRIVKTVQMHQYSSDGVEE